MKQYCVIVLVCLIAGPFCLSEDRKNDNKDDSGGKLSISENRTDSNTAMEDDLSWLLGRWKCVTRQYFVKPQHPLGTDAEDSLDYFNVYLPFADENLTLMLTDNPEDRPIAAEFLVRHVSAMEPFEEKLGPMLELGPVRIGKHIIRYGQRPFNDYEFRYTIEQRGESLWLVLESKFMRLEFFKLRANVGDIKHSFVMAPVKEYSPERIKDLQRQYESRGKVSKKAK